MESKLQYFFVILQPDHLKNYFMEEQEPRSVIYDEFLQLWQKANEASDGLNLEEKYSNMSHILGEYALMNGQLLTIYNHRTHKVIYLSENFNDFLGFDISMEKYKKWSIFYWLRDLPNDQRKFIFHMSVFFTTTLKKYFKLSKKTEKRSLKYYIHNFKLRPGKATSRNLGIINQVLEFNKNGDMEIIMIAVTNLNGLLKNNDDFWVEFNVNDTQKYHYHSKNKKFVAKGVLSERELEILNLIDKGLETKEISEQLNISPNTVDRHRKNILETTNFKSLANLISVIK
jgi:DNA-binding CsgD family transcriptional regulator